MYMYIHTQIYTIYDYIHKYKHIGVINGIGSIIAALGLLIIGPLHVAYGWSAVWILLIFNTIIGKHHH
jgi:hypothetical protein